MYGVYNSIPTLFQLYFQKLLKDSVSVYFYTRVMFYMYTFLENISGSAIRDVLPHLGWKAPRNPDSH